MEKGITTYYEKNKTSYDGNILWKLLSEREGRREKEREGSCESECWCENETPVELQISKWRFGENKAWGWFQLSILRRITAPGSTGSRFENETHMTSGILGTVGERQIPPTSWLFDSAWRQGSGERDGWMLGACPSEIAEKGMSRAPSSQPHLSRSPGGPRWFN